MMSVPFGSVVHGDLRTRPVPGQAVKEAEEFNLGLLDDFVLHAVSIRAFDHIRYAASMTKPRLPSLSKLPWLGCKAKCFLKNDILRKTISTDFIEGRVMKDLAHLFSESVARSMYCRRQIKPFIRRFPNLVLPIVKVSTLCLAFRRETGNIVLLLQSENRLRFLGTLDPPPAARKYCKMYERLPSVLHPSHATRRYVISDCLGLTCSLLIRGFCSGFLWSSCVQLTLLVRSFISKSFLCCLSIRVLFCYSLCAVHTFQLLLCISRSTALVACSMLLV